MPVIAAYFLRFLLQHTHLQDDDKATFGYALQVAERARVELPLINDYVKHSVVAGDAFSAFCRVSFGETLPTLSGLNLALLNIAAASFDVSDSGSSTPDSDSTISLPSTPSRDALTLSVCEATDTMLASDGTDYSWSSRSSTTFVLPPDVSATSTPSAVETTISFGPMIAGEDDPWTIKKPSLPIPDLDCTHSRGIVESSVRRITSVSPPSTGSSEPPTFAVDVEKILAQTLWTVVLAPEPGFRSWRSRDWEAWEGYESATLRVQVDSRDSRDSAICLLVAPSVGQALTRCIGMLLCGDFAELAPLHGGKGELWYLHQMVGLAPSFYEPDRPVLDEETRRAVRQHPPEDLMPRPPQTRAQARS